MQYEIHYPGTEANTHILTCQYGASLALLLHISVFLSWQSERRLKHKSVDVVMPLKICPFFLLLFLVKVGHHIRHLDVGKLGVQVFGIYLLSQKIKQGIMNVLVKLQQLDKDWNSYKQDKTL